MSKFLTGTQAQCAAYQAAIGTAAGLPARGVTLGGPDRVHPLIAGPGWTITATPLVVSVDAATATLEVPDDRLTILGQKVGATQLPTQASAIDKTGLTPALRTAVYAREGKDANGNPLPDPFSVATKVDA